MGRFHIWYVESRGFGDGGKLATHDTLRLNRLSLARQRGSMLNFLDKVDLETGEVQGCLKPSGATGSIYHAKPVIIQGEYGSF